MEGIQYRLEHLWPYPQEIVISTEFPAPTAVYLVGEPSTLWDNGEDIRGMTGLDISEDPAAYAVRFERDAGLGETGSYRLDMTPDGIKVVCADRAGITYGTQTLLQILALFRDAADWPELHICDWPTYRKRCFMVDMGRSVFSMPLLKRVIRILARLKMNQLHLHLYDDELCGIRFDGLPFGSENPYAISIDDLAELVRYATRYHVEIVPELEGWGHVGSLVYHRPELRGGEGMYRGSSFLMCDAVFDLMRELTRQVAGVMPDRATIHLGLDEAKWFLAPSVPPTFAPQQLVGRYGQMLREIGDELGKALTMRVWADHAGRPVPQDIQQSTIIEPWQYWNANQAHIDRAIVKYSGPGKMRWMIGAGQSSAQYRGAYHATRYWCQQAQRSPNIEGVNVTFWENNNLDRNLLSLFAGAYYAWNPNADTRFANQEDYEQFDQKVHPIMYWWQSTFRDAFPDAILQDRGPQVYRGFYLWGSNHGQPVAPTVLPANTAGGHEYLNAGAVRRSAR